MRYNGLSYFKKLLTGNQAGQKGVVCLVWVKWITWFRYWGIFQKRQVCDSDAEGVLNEWKNDWKTILNWVKIQGQRDLLCLKKKTIARFKISVGITASYFFFFKRLASLFLGILTSSARCLCSFYVRKWKNTRMQNASINFEERLINNLERSQHF